MDDLTPTDGTPIDLFGDGTMRTLRYTMATLKRLKRKLGAAMVGPQGGLLKLDEDLLPELIYEGLRGPKGEDPDVTIEQIENISSRRIVYLIETFNAAFFGDMPKKKTDLAAVLAAGRPN